MAVTHVGSNKRPGTYPGGSNNRNDVIVIKPDGVQSGDLLVAFLAAGGINLSNFAGFDLLTYGVYGVHPNNSSFKYYVLYKVAGGSEPSEYSFQFSSDVTPVCGMVHAFRGVDTSDPFLAHQVAFTNGPDNANTPAVTTSGDYALMLHTRIVRWETSVDTNVEQVASSVAVPSLVPLQFPFGGSAEGMGNRGGSVAYGGDTWFSGTSGGAGNVFAPGNQAGVLFEANKDLTESIEIQLGLRVDVPPKLAPATRALASGSAKRPYISALGRGSATATAANATVLTGKAAENFDGAAAAGVAYDAGVNLIGKPNAGGWAYDARVGLGASPDAAQAVGVSPDQNGYFGAPEFHTAYVPAENRVHHVQRR